MKRIVPFSKYFTPAMIFSLVVMLSGVVGYIYHRGFNLGVDFQAGLIQEIQFAPTAFTLTYSGRGNASISFDRNNLYIVVSGAGIEGTGTNYPFSFTSYGTVGALTAALAQVEGVTVASAAPASASSQWLVLSAQGHPQLGSEPYRIHYLPPDSQIIPIEDVRTSLLPLGSVSVQILGEAQERHFLIRLEDSVIEEGGGGVPAEKVISTLENSFGTGMVSVIRSDYVGSRFSKHLSDQVGVLMSLTLLLILLYCSFRFKPQFAVGAVLAMIHDALIMVAFIAWTRMEFNTTTIAAILTILGYSTNDTIVVFDRIRETRRLYPDDSFVNVLDRALTETLGRTFITTISTMLAVLSLFIFTAGSMRDFALALLVGMVSGVYSTIFIASGFVNLWDTQAKKRAYNKVMAKAAAS